MTPLPSSDLLTEQLVTSSNQHHGAFGSAAEAVEELPIQPADLQVIVPAINEESRIGPTIRRLCEHLASRAWVSELIVVDNGSADTTAEVVDRHHGGLLPVEVIGCGRRGKGAAVREGIAHTTAKWIGYCDADLSTSPAAIDHAVELLESGWDVVVGSRRCAGGAYLIPQPPLRRAGSSVFHFLSRRFVGPISDTQCGFKLFRGEVGRELFSTSTVDGFAFDVEILARATRQGHKIVEMPVAWEDRKGSTFRPVSDGIRVLRDLASVQRGLGD